MPPKSPGTSYTGKPVRRLKLPKIGRTRTKSLVEESFYLLLALVFLSVAILGKAGGFSTYNALIVAAWLTALIWFAQQWRAYLAEKSKPENEKNVPPQASAPAETPQGPLPLPPGMKPMIGPQWPMRPGSRAVCLSCQRSSRQRRHPLQRPPCSLIRRRRQMRRKSGASFMSGRRCQTALQSCRTTGGTPTTRKRKTRNQNDETTD